MNRFENKLCPVCRSRFNEKADIVVCPECGTPHHRACYSIDGKCALEELHAKGWSWEGLLPDEIEERQKAVSETAEKELSDLEKAAVDTDFSSHHAEYPSGVGGTSGTSGGDKLDEEERMFDELGGENPFKELFRSLRDKEIGEDGVSMHELAAYSATSVYHYGRAFLAFRGNGGAKKRFVFFNFCSGLFAPIFQFYRRMNFFGVAALLLMIMPSAVVSLLPAGTLDSNAPLAYLLQFAPAMITILLCLFGDYIYYRHCVNYIVRFRKSYDGDTKSDEYYNALYECGKPTFAGGLIGCLALSFAQACVLMLPKLL